MPTGAGGTHRERDRWSVPPRRSATGRVRREVCGYSPRGRLSPTSDGCQGHATENATERMGRKDGRPGQHRTSTIDRIRSPILARGTRPAGSYPLGGTPLVGTATAHSAGSARSPAGRQRSRYECHRARLPAGRCPGERGGELLDRSTHGQHRGRRPRKVADALGAAQWPGTGHTAHAAPRRLSDDPPRWPGHTGAVHPCVARGGAATSARLPPTHLTRTPTYRRGRRGASVADVALRQWRIEVDVSPSTVGAFAGAQPGQRYRRRRGPELVGDRGDGDQRAAVPLIRG